MKVRDELSGEEFHVEGVARVRPGALPRTTWHGTIAMLAAVAANRAAGETWAVAPGEGAVRWVPVTVVNTQSEEV